MCLLLWHYDDTVQGQGPLFVLASNRDEFLDRPSRSAGWHTFSSSSGDSSSCLPGSRTQVLSGLDLEAGGTWLGISQHGHFGTITNYSESKEFILGKRSRGHLVKDWLQYGTGLRRRQSLDDLDEYLAQVNRDKDSYPGFNLLLGIFIAGTDGRLQGRLGYISNRNDETITTNLSGFHGLGNSTLHAPWEKVTKGTSGFSKLVGNEARLSNETIEEIFALMETKSSQGEDLRKSTIMVPQISIPNPFPQSHKLGGSDHLLYGTTVHTIVSIDKAGHVMFIERDAAESEKSLELARKSQRVFRFELL